MKKLFLFFVGGITLWAFLLTFSQKSFAYLECEGGNYTACNTNHKNDGQVMDVSQNPDGSYACTYSGYAHYPYQSSTATCAQTACSAAGGTINSYPECGDATGGPCDNGGKQELITVYHCSANNAYYCQNQGPQPGCGASVNPSTSPSTAPTGSSNAVNISLVVGLQGIGSFGTPPKDTTRSVTIELYDASSTIKPGYPGSKVLGTGSGKLTYDNGTDSNAGYFISTTIPVQITTTSPSGEYDILVKIPQYLYTLVVNDPSASNPNAFTLNPGDSVTTTPIIMHSGGISGDNSKQNSVGVEDYTALLTCFQAHDSTSSSCAKTTDGIAYTDLDDSGNVDIVDFNILLRAIYQLQQVQGACTGPSCNGD